MPYPILPVFLTQTLHASGSVVGLVDGIAQGGLRHRRRWRSARAGARLCRPSEPSGWPLNAGRTAAA